MIALAHMTTSAAASKAVPAETAALISAAVSQEPVS